MSTGVLTQEAKPLYSSNKIHIDRIVAYLEGQSPEAELSVDTLTGCGPFLQRLVHTAQDTHTADRLDDVFQRVAAHFTRCAHITAADNIRELIAQVASKASDVVMEEALFLSPPMSSASQVVWSRVGQLVGQLVRDSAAGVVNVNAHSGNSRRGSTSLLSSNITSNMNKGTENNNYDRQIGQRASPLLLQRIPWKDVCDDKEEFEEKPPAMVSSFTVLWGSIFSFLQLLANKSNELKTEEGKSDDASLVLPKMSTQQQQQHPLGGILTDCVITMMEKNRSLLWEAHEMNQHGAAAEVLCVAANNFAWLLQQCKYLPITNAVEIREVLMQCTADVLQDIITGCSTELHYIFSLYLFPHIDGGQRQQVTPRVLTGRLTATCDICNSLVLVLPKSEVISLLLERLLLPLAERLLDTKEQQHMVDKSNASYQKSLRTHNFYDDDDDNDTGLRVPPSPPVDGSATTLAERVTEILDVLASDTAFGPTICQESSSYCTIRRLLPVMTS